MKIEFHRSSSWIERRKLKLRLTITSHQFQQQQQQQRKRKRTLQMSYSSIPTVDPFTAKAQKMKSPQQNLTSKGSSASSLNGSKQQQLSHGEDTPAYAALQAYGLLNTSYRRERFDDIFIHGLDFEANSSRTETLARRWKWGVYWTPFCGLVIYNIMHTEVTVPAGHVACFTDDDNNYVFARPGVHILGSPFLLKRADPDERPQKVSSGTPIVHGNRTVVTVPQGMLGYASDMGQPVLLPPGLHSWLSETLVFVKLCSLDDHVVRLGPYTIVTVDEGYAAITQNNGKQVILDGGKTHLLTHQKWRFEKFITLKIQTNDLESIRAASADNVIMSVDSTVVWRIVDVKTAAIVAAETMARDGTGAVAADISKLRKDVLKQAIASLAGFIGSVNYSGSFHVAAMAQRQLEVVNAEVMTTPATTEPSSEDNGIEGDEHAVSGAAISAISPTTQENPMFDTVGMSEAVANANEITGKFGVEILGINIISANPVDPTLTSSLATGAVASAEALQAETQARGLAKARTIEAKALKVTRHIDADSEAAAVLVLAKAKAESEAAAALVLAKAKAEAAIMEAESSKRAAILKAEGSVEAARLLEGSAVAVRLETMRTAATSVKDTDKFYFGLSEPSFLSHLLDRPKDRQVATDTPDSTYELMG